MPTQHRTSDARERLMNTAASAFYELGYRAVGIDSIIRDAGIAKATFYAHFKSKESLYTAVLKKTSDEALAFMQAFINSRETALERLLGPIDFLLQWLPQKPLRGCPFLNMTAEIYDYDSEAREIGGAHYKKIRACIAEQAQELIRCNPDASPHITDDRFQLQYMTIYTGAIALSALWQDTSPLQSARETLLDLIGAAPSTAIAISH